MKTESNLWDQFRARWYPAPGLPSDDHLRLDIGLQPLPGVRRIPVMVFAWLH